MMRLWYIKIKITQYTKEYETKAINENRKMVFFRLRYPLMFRGAKGVIALSIV